MKVLLITQYFYPEDFKSNDIAFELVNRGYDVTVLTGIPNYPKGRFYQGYGVFKNRKEKKNGVTIIRSLLIPRGKGNGFRLVLNYFSWAFFASLRVLFLPRFDAIIVHEPSPITQGIPAVLLKRIQKIPLYFWVLDLWPESLVSAGGVKNRTVLSFFTWITNCIYRNSDKILISSNGFKKSILEKGDYENKLVYFPNWAEDIFDSEPNAELLDLPSGFKIMFAGNIGEAQDLEHVMQTALLLKEENDIKILLLGDGRKKKWAEDFVYLNDLQEVVYFLGRYPIEMMPSFFKQADVMLLSLKDELIFNLTVPAKLQAYMASSKPILGMINGEGAQIIKDSGCGFAVRAGDSVTAAKRIKEMHSMSVDDLEIMGGNGRKYYEMYFDKMKCIEHLCNLLEKR